MVPVRIISLLVAAALLSPGTAPSTEVAVIVHVSVTDRLDLGTIRRIFLARQRFWRDGTAVRPVNQGARSAARLLFTEIVLGGTIQDYAPYWNDLWFHGTAPPAVLASDQAVLLYVARTEGAIGYVEAASARASPDGIRLVTILRAP